MIDHLHLKEVTFDNVAYCFLRCVIPCRLTAKANVLMKMFLNIGLEYITFIVSNYVKVIYSNILDFFLMTAQRLAPKRAPKKMCLLFLTVSVCQNYTYLFWYNFPFKGWPDICLANGKPDSLQVRKTDFLQSRLA